MKGLEHSLEGTVHVIFQKNDFQYHWPETTAHCWEILTSSAFNILTSVKCLVVGLKGIPLQDHWGLLLKKKTLNYLQGYPSTRMKGDELDTKNLREAHAHQGAATCHLRFWLSSQSSKLLFTKEAHIVWHRAVMVEGRGVAERQKQKMKVIKGS